MNHRRRKAVRFEKLLWITREPRRALVFNLINTSLPKSGFLACISSRITTVIQVVRYYQINDNWFNEPFAVSQYKLLILRHAWLNLWDKHMTTGRINQVTILALTSVKTNSATRSLLINNKPEWKFLNDCWLNHINAGASVIWFIISAEADNNNQYNIHLPRLNSLNNGPRRITLDIRQRRSNESLHILFRRRL